MLQDKKRQHYCLVPITAERKFDPEVSNHRANSYVLPKKWVNGTVLHYCFLDDSHLVANDAQKKVVIKAFEI